MKRYIISMFFILILISCSNQDKFSNSDNEETVTFDLLVDDSLNEAEKMFAISKDIPYDELNTEALSNEYLLLKKSYAEMADYKTNHPEQFKFSARLNYDGYLTAFREFVTASDELTNRKKNNTRFSSGEKMNLNPSAGWMVKGSTFKVLKKYNDLVEKHNRLIN